MKRLTFWAITTAAMLASCNNHDKSEQEILPNGRKAITFQVSEQPLTRYKAESATIDSLTSEGSGFTVTAVSGATAIIDDQTFFANETGGCEADDGAAYFWPDGDSVVSFYAYYPSSYYDYEVPPCTLNVADGTMLIRPDGETDIMAAHYEGNADTNDGNVFFNFKHLLSQISIYVSCDEQDIFYPGIILDGLSIEAPESSNYDFNTGKVVAENMTREYTFVKNTISVYDFPEYIGTAMIPASSPIVDEGMVKKQTSCTLKVAYAVLTNSGSKSYEKSFNISLAAGYRSTLKIVLSRNNVVATISSVVVENWQEDDGEIGCL